MQGRCDGCGAEGSAKSINTHIGRCPRYAERFRAGDVLRDPAVAYREHHAGRKPATVARQPRVARPEVSVPAARVAPPRISRTAPAVGAVERVAGPVTVEVWDVPSSF